MSKFLPGHPKIPGSGRKKGQTFKKKGVPQMSDIRTFLIAQAWNPLVEIHALMPKLSPYQQARINMEMVGMEQRERLGLTPATTPPEGESEESKRVAAQTAAEFVAALPVKLDEPNGNSPHSGAS